RPEVLTAEAEALGHRLGVLVVALEAGAGADHDDLAGGLLGVEQPPLLVEERARALRVVLGAADLRREAGHGNAQSSGRAVGRGHDADDPFARAVALAYIAAEPAPELDCLRRSRLRAERHLEPVLGVLGTLGLGEDVAEHT